MADQRASRPSYPHGALPAGTRLGEFEVRRVLGVGGFGIVYEAFDHLLEREVAVKEYMPASLVERNEALHVTLISEASADTFALGLRSFVNEARLLARFDHPSLLKVHRFWEANGTAYMAMPLYRGRTARDVRQQMGQHPDEAWVRGLLEPLLGAIEKLHSEDVYHRDIAPDNILIEADGRPVLLDFGAARRVITDRSQTLTAILKPSYAPIEQYADVSGMKQGPWTDLYALGATVHFLLLGKPPPPAPGRSIQDTMPSLSQQALAGFTAPFLALVDWMLSPLPADRPQSVAMVREVLAGRAAAPERKPPSPFERTATLPGPSPSATETADDATIVMRQPPAPAPAADFSDETVIMPRSALAQAIASAPADAGAASAASSGAAPSRPASSGLWLPDDPPAPPGGELDATILQPRAAPPAPGARTAASAAARTQAAAPTSSARSAQAAHAHPAAAHPAAAHPAAAHPAANAGSPAPSRMLPLVAGSALALLVGVGLWWFLGRSSAPAPAESASAAPPAFQQPAPPLPTPEPTPAARSEPAALPPVAAQPPAQAPAQPATVTAAGDRPATTATPAAAPAATPSKGEDSPAQAAPASMAAKPATNGAAAKPNKPPPRSTEAARPRAGETTPAMATTTTPERAPTPAAKPAARPAPEAPAAAAATATAAPASPAAPEAAARPESPSERCAKELPLVRMICMDVVCFRSEFKKHPECVELRAEQAKKRMLEGQ